MEHDYGFISLFLFMDGLLKIIQRLRYNNRPSIKIKNESRILFHPVTISYILYISYIIKFIPDQYSCFFNIYIIYR